MEAALGAGAGISLPSLSFSLGAGAAGALAAVTSTQMRSDLAVLTHTLFRASGFRDRFSKVSTVSPRRAVRVISQVLMYLAVPTLVSATSRVQGASRVTTLSSTLFTVAWAAVLPSKSSTTSPGLKPSAFFRVRSAPFTARTWVLALEAGVTTTRRSSAQAPGLAAVSFSTPVVRLPALASPGTARMM